MSDDNNKPHLDVLATFLVALAALITVFSVLEEIA